jgi:hypothetical protein
MATGVATTEIQPKDANSSFVRGVNTIWAFMFVEVSQCGYRGFAARTLGASAPPQQPPQRRRPVERAAASRVLPFAGAGQLHLNAAPATLHTLRGGSRPALQVRSV